MRYIPTLAIMSEGQVIQAGYGLNVPLRVIPVESHRGDLPAAYSFIQVDTDRVIVEAVKKAEDSDDLIVRLYEACGMGARPRLHFNVEIGSASLATLMEQELEPLATTDRSIALGFTPFEIKTVKVG